MTNARLALVVCLAGASGLGLGVATRGRASGPERPTAVEAALAAVDRDDVPGARRAAEAAGDPDGYPSPWREELRLARLVGAGDHDGLWRFATEGDPAAARARALVYLVQRGRTEAEKLRAKRRMLDDYPDSWASALLRKVEDPPR